MVKSTFKHEKGQLDNGYQYIIGIDEVGRGPLSGPVVAAAVLYHDLGFKFPKGMKGDFDIIRDSKTLSQNQRVRANDLVCNFFYVGIGQADSETIDRMNILEASFFAMKKAITELKQVLMMELDLTLAELDEKILIVVDGAKEIPNLSLNQEAYTNGDKYLKTISAASIVAKVFRDELMVDYHNQYPEYGFDKHKGYGTKQHMEALNEFGPCPIHRKSFKPVAQCLSGD